MEAESGVAFPHLRTLHRPAAEAAEATEQAHGHAHAPPAATATAAVTAGTGSAARTAGALPDAGLEPQLDAGLGGGQDGGQDGGLEASLHELAALRAASRQELQRPLSLQELRHHTVRYVQNHHPTLADLRRDAPCVPT